MPRLQPYKRLSVESLETACSEGHIWNDFMKYEFAVYSCEEQFPVSFRLELGSFSWRTRWSYSFLFM
jgi:hypothetical protein